MTQLSTQQNILITGGAGFIGSHTVDALLKKNIPVTVFDNLSSGKISNLNLNSPLLRFIEGDILDYPQLMKAVKGCTGILHLAALPSVPRSIEDPVQSHAINTLGFLHVLQAIHELQRPIRLVYASSSAVYGEAKSLPCQEEASSESDVLSPYALQKIHSEQYAAMYAKLFGLQSLALRYFNVYGSRQDPQSVYSGVISRFLDLYEQEQVLTIYGDGQQSRDFIHVEDVARANCLALAGDYHGVLNIATGIPETLNQLVSYIGECGGRKAAVELAPPRLGDIQDSYAATRKAELALDFRYKISLREGIGCLVRHSRESGNLMSFEAGDSRFRGNDKERYVEETQNV